MLQSAEQWKHSCPQRWHGRHCVGCRHVSRSRWRRQWCYTTAGKSAAGGETIASSSAHRWHCRLCVECHHLCWCQKKGWWWCCDSAPVARVLQSVKLLLSALLTSGSVATCTAVDSAAASTALSALAVRSRLHRVTPIMSVSVKTAAVLWLESSRKSAAAGRRVGHSCAH